MATNEIKLKIGADTSSLSRDLEKMPAMAEAAGRKASQAYSKASLSARKSLDSFRQKQAYDEASTVGKVKIVTQELADLSYAQQRTAKGTTQYYKQQLEIEEKMALLRKNQKKAQTERVANLPGVGGTGGAEDAAPPGIKAQLAGAAFGLVAGVVGFAIQRLSAWNAGRVQVAEAQDSSSAAGLQSLRAKFASVGGLRGQLTQGQGTLKDLEGQRDTEQSRADFLSKGIQGAVSGIAPAELVKAETNVQRLNAEIQRQHDANQLIERDLKRQTGLRETLFSFAVKATGGARRRANGTIDIGEAAIDPKNPIGSIPETERARAKGSYNSLRAIIIEGRRLVKAAMVEKNSGTPESYANAQVAVEAQRNEARSAIRGLQRQQLDVNQQLAGEAAGGRTDASGRQVPLSETERLAQRAASYRQRARDAVLTGQAFDSKRYRGLAIADEAKVAERLASGSRFNDAPKGTEDRTALKPTLDQANTLLTAIKESLETTNN